MNLLILESPLLLLPWRRRDLPSAQRSWPSFLLLAWSVSLPPYFRCPWLYSVQAKGDLSQLAARLAASLRLSYYPAFYETKTRSGTYYQPGFPGFHYFACRFWREPALFLLSFLEALSLFSCSIDSVAVPTFWTTV